MYFAAGSAISAPSASWDPNPGGWRDEVGQVSETNKDNNCLLQVLRLEAVVGGDVLFGLVKE